MPKKQSKAGASAELHGSVPENHPVAVVLVDVINDMEFEGGADLLEHALPMAKRLAALARRAREAGIPVIYVNDNFGKWRSDFRALLKHCREDDVRGKPVVELLVPKKSDYFVLKPKHSAFFSTTFDTLLEYLHTSTLIITGLTTDLCVLLTASDAHMRDLKILVPRDCCAATDTSMHELTLQLMERNLDADVRASKHIDFSVLTKASGANDQRVTKTAGGADTVRDR